MTNTIISLDHSSIIEAAAIDLLSGCSVAIVGDSGVGKTDLAKQLAEEIEAELVVIEGVFLAEKELGGLPYIVDGQVKYARHPKIQRIIDLLAEGKRVLLFTDEANRAERAVLNELMALALAKTVGEDNFKGQELYVVIAINPDGGSINYGVETMNPALNLRFSWFELKPSLKAWIDYATTQGVDELIISFLANYPDHFHVVSEDSRISTNPRTWVRTSDVLKFFQSDNYYSRLSSDKKNELLMNVISSNIGMELAGMLLNEASNLPLIKPIDVVNGVKNKVVSQELTNRMKEETSIRVFATLNLLLNTITKIENLEELFNEKLDLTKKEDKAKIENLLKNKVIPFAFLFREQGKEDVVYSFFKELFDVVTKEEKTPLVKLLDRIIETITPPGAVKDYNNLIDWLISNTKIF